MKEGIISKQMQLYFQTASKHDIESIITLANSALKGRFLRQKKPKYGHLSKYVPNEIFEQILEAADSAKLFFIFKLMKALALRVGEVPTINIKNIDIDKRQILIPCTEKSHMPDICYFDNATAIMIKNWIDNNWLGIKKHNGYIIHPEDSSNSKRENLSMDYIRNHFREACHIANIQINYGLARNTGYKLNLYTTHSLRHTGITDFYCKTRDLHLTMMYARHQDINSTLHYIHQSQEELKQAVMNLNYKASIMDDIKERLHILEELVRKHPIKECLIED